MPNEPSPKQERRAVAHAKIAPAISEKKLKLQPQRIWKVLRPQKSRPHNTMASVYKSLSKTNGHEKEGPANGVKKNKQRVLILSSRGITYR